MRKLDNDVETLRVLPAHCGWRINDIGVLPNGNIVCGSDDKKISLWNAETGKCLWTRAGHTGPVLCVRVLPNGHIVSGSWDKTLRIWDSQGGLFRQTLEGHKDAIYSICVLVNGNIVSGSAKTLGTWHFPFVHTLEFIAHFFENGNKRSLHEISEFHKINDEWFYVSGQFTDDKPYVQQKH